jgi:hypothetical protein
MCPHNVFDIVYYGCGVMARKCRSCGETEIKTERWTTVEALAAALEFLGVHIG